MRLFNWAEDFKKNLTREDILKKVQKLEVLYWIKGMFGCVCLFAGLASVCMAPPGNIKLSSLGILITIHAVAILITAEISSRIKLLALRNAWDKLDQTESELRKSEAMDL